MIGCSGLGNGRLRRRSPLRKYEVKDRVRKAMIPRIDANVLVSDLKPGKRKAPDWLRADSGRANLSRIDRKIVRPKQRRVPASSGRCGVRKLECTSRVACIS